MILINEKTKGREEYPIDGLLKHVSMRYYIVYRRMYQINQISNFINQIMVGDYLIYMRIKSSPRDMETIEDLI